ncbi:MAG: hypothetical protein LBV26_04215 [Bacteroidales bacterium]|jgi:glucosamine--fructose-6-phosphate aminotransferase (isomerizing)|nr:hypothetical protein [Bacteroidales bacterium]
MNLKEEKYSRYALVREMMETPSIIRTFKPDVATAFAQRIKACKGLFLTGEGSSRIFPAKRAISRSLQTSFGMPVVTEGCTQALDYNLSSFAVFAASNSGQTKEVVRLLTALRNAGHSAIFGLTANGGTKLCELAGDTHVLLCGKEDAVAATKSVVEQALFYDSLLRVLHGVKMDGLAELAAQFGEALTAGIDPAITNTIKKARTVYFAGRNNGVAEELALKTNEITRKKSDFLEGTFALHGIEEVMDKDDALIWIDPFDSEQEQFDKRLAKGAGINVIAISAKPTMFPTAVIPDAGEYAEYVQLAAGWNILVETGLATSINLDKPERARKVGNEYSEQ